MWENAYLSDDGAELAAGSADAVRCGAVTCGEDFTGDNEGGCVGAKVLEEVGHAVL